MSPAAPLTREQMQRLGVTFADQQQPKRAPTPPKQSHVGGCQATRDFLLALSNGDQFRASDLPSICGGTELYENVRLGAVERMERGLYRLISRDLIHRPYRYQRMPKAKKLPGESTRQFVARVIAASDGEIHASTLRADRHSKNYLHRLCKKRALKIVRRGVYATCNRAKLAAFLASTKPNHTAVSKP